MKIPFGHALTRSSVCVSVVQVAGVLTGIGFLQVAYFMANHIPVNNPIKNNTTAAWMTKVSELGKRSFSTASAPATCDANTIPIKAMFKFRSPHFYT